MSGGRIRFFCVTTVLIVLAWGASGEESPAQAAPAAESGVASSVPDGRSPQEVATSSPDRHWYMAFGSSNFHPRLAESEAQIDHQMNDLLGWMPAWKNPITFKDWAEDFKLWDVTFGVGRDFTPRTSWMIWAGGATANIENNERYGLVSTDIQFSRFTAFLTLQGYWYPWDKVDHDAVAGEHGMARATAALANAKPYLSLATGYVYMQGEGDGKFKLPAVGTFFRQKEEYIDHMYHVSPRLGIELPISKNNSITAEGLYYFFGPNQDDEYNGPSVNVMFKHRF